MTEPASWSDLDKREPQPVANPRFDEVCTVVFSSGPGRELLGMLRTKYFDSPASPLADERALRVRATQQHFVRELERACDRGLTAAKPKTP